MTWKGTFGNNLRFLWPKQIIIITSWNLNSLIYLIFKEGEIVIMTSFDKLLGQFRSNSLRILWLMLLKESNRWLYFKILIIYYQFFVPNIILCVLFFRWINSPFNRWNKLFRTTTINAPAFSSNGAVYCIPCTPEIVE